MVFGKKKQEDTSTTIENLRDRGLTCSKIKTMINKQMTDAKRDREDASKLRTMGFNQQADYQENIAKAQEKSAQALRDVKRKLCPLK